MPTSVFVSYSHKDSKLVQPIVGILRGAVNSVFHDVVAITPGKKWEQSIKGAIAECNLVVVFWCTHSAISDEVRKEYEFAISESKNLMPLLLDKTPLPGKLREYQWVDLRELGLRKHGLRLQWVVMRPLRCILAVGKALVKYWWLPVTLIALILVHNQLIEIHSAYAQLKDLLSRESAAIELKNLASAYLLESEVVDWRFGMAMLILWALEYGVAIRILSKAFDLLGDSNTHNACELIIQGLVTRGLTRLNP
jgi:hypothetical protein